MSFLIMPFEFLFVQLILPILKPLVKWAFKIVLVCLPQLVTSFVLTPHFLSGDTAKQTRFWTVIAATTLLYVLTLVAKWFMQSLKEGGSLLWIPVFVFLLSYTCLMPGWMMYHFLAHTLKLADPALTQNLSAFGGLVLAFCLYLRNNFLASTES